MARRNRWTVALAIVVSMLLWAGSVGAAGEAINFASSYGGATRGCFLDGTTLYQVTGGKLEILDITTPSTPVLLGTAELSGVGRRVWVDGTTLYAACWKGGLQIIDVSNPASPQILSTTRFDDATNEEVCETFDVEVRNNYAFVADQTAGLVILDVSTPASPTEVGRFDSFHVDKHRIYDVNLSNDIAILCCEFAGLYIVDISDLANPVEYSHVEGQFYQSIRDDDYLYIAGGKGLFVFDFSNVLAPTQLSNLDNPDYGGVLGLAKVGTNVYLSTEFGEFYEVDVTDPSTPTQSEIFEVHPFHSLGIDSQGTTVALANHNYGLRLFDVSGPTIQQVGGYRSIGQIMDCQGSGNYAYAAALYSGLQILDVSDSAAPTVAAAVELAGDANGVFVDGDLVYVAEVIVEEVSGGFLEIIDVSDINNPVVLDTVELEGRPFDVEVVDGYAYVAEQTDGITIVDVSDSSNARVITDFDTNGSCYQVLYRGGMLFGADGKNGVVVIDVRNPAAPVLIIGGLDAGLVQDIAIWDTWAFLPGGSDGLQVVDFYQPGSPVFLDTPIEPVTVNYAEGRMKAAAAWNSYLFTVEQNGGVRLFDLSPLGAVDHVAGTGYSATLPELATNTHMFGDPVKITYAADQQMAYASSQLSGLYMFDVTVDAAPTRYVDGIWAGEGENARGRALGLDLMIDQDRGVVQGTITVQGAMLQTGTFTGTIAADNMTATVDFGLGRSAALALAYDPIKGTLRGALTGDVAVAEITMEPIDLQGLFWLDTFRSLLIDSIALDRALGAGGLTGLALRKAQDALERGAAQALLSSQLTLALPAALWIEYAHPEGLTDVANGNYPDAAVWELGTLQGVAYSSVQAICGTYRDGLETLYDKGETLAGRAVRQIGLGNTMGGLLYAARAAYFFEQVINLAEIVEPYCPGYDIAEFEGYYEGAIDFGFSMGDLKLCVTQADNGTISGGGVIAIGATGEKVGGYLRECENDTSTGKSIVNGYIQAFVGSTEAHILIIDWKHNPSNNQWEGSVDVDLQPVNATGVSAYISATCPDSYYEDFEDVLPEE